jgi:hypothetical protein
MPLLTLSRSLWIGAGLAALAVGASEATLHPFAGTGGTPAAPWRVVGLPQQTKPYTRFSVVDLDGHRALRVEARESYGNLVHPLHTTVSSAHLAWQWRMDEPNALADLHAREGDDIAIKVCVMWDMPIEDVPFFERQVLRIARSRAGEALPAATVCYVWDAHLPVGTRLDSPFTRRLRYIVLRSAGDALHRWTAEQRDIAADFLALFGTESHHHLPPLAGIAVGADADNTHGHSLAHAADLQLQP